MAQEKGKEDRKAAGNGRKGFGEKGFERLKKSSPDRFLFLLKGEGLFEKLRKGSPPAVLRKKRKHLFIT